MNPDGHLVRTDKIHTYMLLILAIVLKDAPTTENNAVVDDLE